MNGMCFDCKIQMALVEMKANMNRNTLALEDRQISKED